MTEPFKNNQKIFLKVRRGMKRNSYIVIAILLILQVAAQTQNKSIATQDSKAAPVEVKIDNFSFTPATITVAAGTTVRWTNRDDIPHTVVSDDQKFESKALDTDDQYSFTFTKPGTYGYFCSIHPKMTGKVVVQ
jgi:plastocyanin